MSKILNTKCADDEIAMAMDSNARPRCVWVSGTKLKYAEFNGTSWVILNDSASIISSENALSVCKNSLGIDGDGYSFIVYMDGEDLKMSSWNGSSWDTETIWSGLNSIDPLAWAVAWNNCPFVMVVTRSAGSKRIWEIDKSTGSWSVPASSLIPTQTNEEVELKIAKVASWIYAFWTGKDEDADTAWIGHIAWDTDTKAWAISPQKISMSETDGQITGIDFVAGNELESSSSSESSVSSLSSIT